MAGQGGEHRLGSRAGGTGVTCYVTVLLQQGPGVREPPKRVLFDFARVEDLGPGESTALSFTLTPRGRSLVTEGGVRVHPGGRYATQCKAGGVAKTASAEFTVAS